MSAAVDENRSVTREIGEEIERLAHYLDLTRECGFADLEASIQNELRRAQGELTCLLCTSDGARRAGIAALVRRLDVVLDGSA